MKKYHPILLILVALSFFQPASALDYFDGIVLAANQVISATDDKALLKQGLEHYKKKTKEGDRKAFSLFSKAANLGNYYAADKVYFMGLAKRGVKIDSQLSWMKKASELGSPSAQHDIAGRYQRGQGVKKDLKKAASLFLKSAKHGHYHAKHDISYLYYGGQGVKKNRGLAIFWAKKAAKHNIASSHLNLGRWLENSQSSAELAESKKWYKSAEKLLKMDAAKGDKLAGNLRAGLYENGRGVKKDLALAFDLYQNLAGQGHGASQYALARMYDRGLGVSPDRLETIRWLKISAKNGYPPAIKALKNME